MFCLKITVLVATNMTADCRTPDHKSQKFGNKHVMLHVLTVGFTASDDVMCWSGLILCMCNSSTCGWSRRKEASKISAMNTWAGFTPTLLTCDSAVLYWHTNWNNSTNQQFVMRWNIFPKQEALHSNECLQDCGVRKWDHPPLRNRTENRSELIIRTGSRWFK